MTDRARQGETSSTRSGLSGHHSTSGFEMAGSLSTEWTNAKHSSYLTSMEASFVKQLYNDEYDSLDLLGWRSRRTSFLDTSSFEHLNVNIRTSSGQFKVLQSGCWKKVDFERAPQKLSCVENSHVLLGNPWIQHFKPLEKQQEVAPSRPEKDGGFCLEAVPKRWQTTSSIKVSSLKDDSILSYEEVSDQNFVDEENELEKLDSRPRIKRMKKTAAGLSTIDQVVPNGKSPLIVDCNANYASLENKHPQTCSEAEKTGSILCLEESGSPYYSDPEPKGDSCS